MGGASVDSRRIRKITTNTWGIADEDLQRNHLSTTWKAKNHTASSSSKNVAQKRLLKSEFSKWVLFWALDLGFFRWLYFGLLASLQCSSFQELLGPWGNIVYDCPGCSSDSDGLIVTLLWISRCCCSSARILLIIKILTIHIYYLLITIGTLELCIILKGLLLR